MILAASEESNVKKVALNKKRFKEHYKVLRKCMLKVGNKRINKEYEADCIAVSWGKKRLHEKV